MRRQVNDRPVRLDQVVRQIERVELAVVVQAESRMKADGDQASGDIASYDCVSVIQTAVDRILRFAVEAFVEETEVLPGCQRFVEIDVFRGESVGISCDLFRTVRNPIVAPFFVSKDILTLIFLNVIITMYIYTQFSGLRNDIIYGGSS